MATRRIHIRVQDMVPDTTGSVFPEPQSIKATNDRYPLHVMIFKDSGTKISAGFSFEVPDDFVSAPVFRPRWSTPTITGSAVWDVDYTAVGGDDTESLDPATDQEALTVTDVAPTAANRRLTPSLAATAANFAAGKTVIGKISRDGLDAADTLAADIMLYGLTIEYSNV